MFLQKVIQTVKEHIRIEKGATIVVGVSGGADSVTLLNVLHMLADENAWKLVVCHVDHGLRGKESKADARFVEQLSHEWNVPFVLGEFDVAAYAHKLKESIEVSARLVRYDFFENVMRQYGASYLALGHHADDQAETVLMRVLRGTSTSGLSGMSFTREWRGKVVVRPLLAVWRKEIERFCKEQQLLYRTDATNLSVKYQRNKIRLELIPFLEHAYNPNIKERLLKLGNIARAEDQYLEREAKKWLDEHCECMDKQFVRISRGEFRKLDVALQPRVIKLILYYLSGYTTTWESIHIDTVTQYIISSQNIQHTMIAHEVYCSCEYDYAKIHTYVETPEILSAYELKHTGSETIRYGSFLIYSEVIREHTQFLEYPENGKWEVFISLDNIGDMAVQIRTRATGDSIQPFGMSGTVKVKKLMIDYKVPASLRNQWPIVMMGNTVVWIPGIRRSKHFLVQSDTKTVLHMRAVYDAASVDLKEC